jgi:hypothetical protein
LLAPPNNCRSESFNTASSRARSFREGNGIQVVVNRCRQPSRIGPWAQPRALEAVSLRRAHAGLPPGSPFPLFSAPGACRRRAAINLITTVERASEVKNSPPRRRSRSTRSDSRLPTSLATHVRLGSAKPTSSKQSRAALLGRRSLRRERRPRDLLGARALS